MPDLIPFPIHEACHDINTTMDAVGDSYRLLTEVTPLFDDDDEGFLLVSLRVDQMKAFTEQHLISLVRIIQKYGLSAEVVSVTSESYNRFLSITMRKKVATVTGSR